jgi:hypothetical protein
LDCPSASCDVPRTIEGLGPNSPKSFDSMGRC